MAHHRLYAENRYSLSEAAAAAWPTLGLPLEDLLRRSRVFFHQLRL